MIAVRQCGPILQHASAQMPNNEEIVMAAVQQNAHSLQYASRALTNNETFKFFARGNATTSIDK